MTEQDYRAAVCDEAATWLGTKFHDCARIKGVGVDCGMFPLAVYVKIGLARDFDPGHYSVQVHLHKPDTKYVDYVRSQMRQIWESDVKPGDLVIYKEGFAFAHSAIVIEWPNKIIHAVVSKGVMYDDAQRYGRLQKREKEFYSFFGKA